MTTTQTSEPGSKTSARKPIYYIARTISDFLFTSLKEESSNNEMVWKFFVGLCCCSGLQVRCRPGVERYNYFVNSVDEPSSKSAFSLPTPLVESSPPLSRNFEMVLSAGFPLLDRVLPPGLGIVPFHPSSLTSEAFFENENNLRMIMEVVDVIETADFSEATSRNKYGRVLDFLKSRKHA